MSKKDKKINSLAYPVAPTGNILQRPRDVSKWAQAAREIQKYVNQGYPINKSFEHVTKNWDDMDRYDFHNWVKFYKENSHLKYKMAQENNTNYLHLGGVPTLPWSHLKAKLPTKNPDIPFMSQLKNIEESMDAKDEMQAKEEADKARKEELEKKIKSLSGRLRSALKIMSDPDVQQVIGPKMDISLSDWVSQLQDLQRYIMLVSPKLKYAETLDDLVIRRIGILRTQGLGSVAADMLLSIAQEVEPPPVEELADEMGEGPPVDKDAPKEEEGGPGEEEKTEEEGEEEEGFPNISLEDSPELPEDEEDDISIMEKLIARMNLRDPEFDDLSLDDDLAEIVVVEAQVFPGPDKMSIGPQPEFVVEEEDNVNQNQTNQANQNHPRTGATVKRVIERLEGISNVLKNREIPRQFNIVDLELAELGMASYFPTLAEATKSALDSNQYMLTRVEDILSKLRGSLQPSMDIDLDTPSPNEDPALEAVRDNLEREEQQEKARQERRRQERLAPPEEVAPAPQPDLERPVEIEKAPPTRIVPEA